MLQVIVTEGAAEGLDRCRKFLAAKTPDVARRAGQAIERQFLLLETTPDIGRPFPQMPELRELVIAFGDSGYVALYRHEPSADAVHILVFRQAPERGGLLISMNEFRRLAAKIDQHMQQLSAQGVSEAHAVINHMMGYVPDLHKIWVGTSDQQLMALSRKFPEFYRYASIMEEASEAGRCKASRPYDGMAEFSEEHKQINGRTIIDHGGHA